MNGSPPTSGPPYLKFVKYLAGLDPKKPISPKQESEMWSCMTNAVIGIVMLVLASALIYVASTDQAAASNRMYVYSVLIIVPVLVAAYMMVPTFGSKPSGTKLTAYGIFLCALFIIAYFLMRNMSMKQIVYANYLIMFLGIGLAILLVILLSKISTRYLMSLEGWTGFIVKLIMYIPCLVSEFVVGSVAIMPNLYAKIAVILVYIALFLTIIYYIIDAFASTEILRLNNSIKSWINGVSNVQSSEYNKSSDTVSDEYNKSSDTVSDESKKQVDTTISAANDVSNNIESFSVNDVFKIPDWFKERAYIKSFYNTDIYPLNVIKYKDITGLDDSSLQTDTTDYMRSKNYTISAWIYLPAQTPWSRILSLRKASDASNKEVGSPSVMYSQDKLRITLSNAPSNPIIKEVPILPQRWNQMVFVYENNTVHFYLNSELKFSEPLTDALPTYSFSDELVTGDETQIVGKIGGFAYAPTTYSAQQIVTIYNATRQFYV